MSTKPMLRPLDFQPVIYQGEQMWYLRDPLRLTEAQLIMPPPLAGILQFMDGTRSPDEIHDEFCRFIGVEVDYAVVTHTLAQLDQALLLDNERARRAEAAQLAEYREQSYRLPALAGLSYPADPDALTAQLLEYGDGDGLAEWPEWSGRAIVSPHIDYMRGGPVYSRVWRRATQAVAGAELVIIFGTDHNGGDSLITLTRQPYATPFGPLPGAPELVGRLACAYGEEAAFARELNHRAEHSVELSAVWLHHTFRQSGVAPCPVVPILCGSFGPFLEAGRHPAGDERLNRLIAALQRESAGKRVLAVASVDLAHVGPNFGDRFKMTESRRERLMEDDRSLIEAVNAGDHERFFAEIAAVRDHNRICGFSSIYIMLRWLEQAGGAPVHGEQIAYAHCPADAEDASLVSICGLLLQ